MKNLAPNPEGLLPLVGQIYDSATDPARLPGVLRLFNEFVRGTTTQLFIRDIGTGAILASQVGDAAQEAMGRHYVSHWGAFDPRVKWLASRPANKVLRCHEQFDDAFVAGSSFYQDFMVPHGLRWSLAGRYPGEPGTETVIVNMRPAGARPYEPWAANALLELLPHFERSGAIAAKLERQAAAVQSAMAMMKSLPTPCLLTDHVGRCLEGNEAFSLALEPLAMRLATGRVRFVRPDVQARWESALFEAHTTALPATMVFTDAGGRQWKARLLPWQPAVEAGDNADTKMIVALFSEVPAQAHPMPQPGSMAATARLTRAEVEVLAGLLKGLPAKAIAARRSASVNTVRTQIVSILEKTGYSSQKELMASFSVSMLPDSAFASSAFDSQPRIGETVSR
ncbi:MAG: helix-turn-helix transcriptional regulator [Ramlibacter sp.]|nr:helix-turn-helix transcriptional regulator [Ramlibacter sp.]